MAEELQAATWFSPTTNMLSPPYSCSTENYFKWKNFDVLDAETCPYVEPNDDNNNFGDISKYSPRVQQDDLENKALIDSALEMMGYGLSSSVTSFDWNQSFIDGPGRDEVYNSLLQEDINSKNSAQQSLMNPSGRFPLTPLECLFDQEKHQQSVFNNQLINDGISLPWPNTTPFEKPSLLSSWTAQTFSPDLVAKVMHSYQSCTEEIQHLEVESKTNNESVSLKRRRIDTLSPLPSFKLRKEKLGDRITALQQLVSPFGKTDTASVLHEAVNYINFLHEQVNVLSLPPDMKHGVSTSHQQVGEGPKQELKSRGLCLVPLSSTIFVTDESTNELWAPAFWSDIQEDSMEL